MDPMSLTTGVISLIGICTTIAQVIKEVIQKAKNTKSALIKLLDKVEHVRIYLTQLRSLAARLVSPEQRKFIIPFDHSACETTLERVKTMVDRICGSGEAGKWKIAVAWFQERKAAEDLVHELDEHEKRIAQAFSAISAVSSVITKEALDQMLVDSMEAAKFKNPFETTTLVTQEPSEDILQASQLVRWQMWPAQVTRDEMPQGYLGARDKLADAAFWGEWDKVFECVEDGRIHHEESWVNGPRMKLSSQLGETSLWTPLHQAAYLGASQEVVEELVRCGASRTLRTGLTDTELSYRDLTAAEIAREMGFLQLTRILAPIILHPLPFMTVDKLQTQLHRLIKSVIDDETFVIRLRLPVLTVLTELEDPIMWFPVYRDGVKRWTFQYFLDGRQLLVQVHSHQEGIAEQSFRCTETEWTAIEEPLANAASV